MKETVKCLIRASLKEKEYKAFQSKQEADKNAFIEYLTNRLRKIMETPKRGKIKGKAKPKQKLYKASKEVFQKIGGKCITHISGKEEHIIELLDELSGPQKHGDYGLGIGIAVPVVGIGGAAVAGSALAAGGALAAGVVGAKAVLGSLLVGKVAGKIVGGAIGTFLGRGKTHGEWAFGGLFHDGLKAQ